VLDGLANGNLMLYEIDASTDTVLIKSSTEDYDTECEISRHDAEGKSVTNGAPDWNY
jgi:hypothetical protein